MAEMRPPENGMQDGSAVQEQDLWKQTVETVFRGAPSWLFSVIVHVGVLILLALIFFPEVRENLILLDASTYAEEEGDQLDFETLTVGQDQEDPIITPETLPPVDDPLATPPVPTVESSLSTIPLSEESLNIGLALKGRTPGMKNTLLGMFGGDKSTEAAVNAGLYWLAKNQQRDGSWSLKGPYGDGSGSENYESATAMALLAFQGAGHTHRSSTKYSKNVAKGLKWLLAQQDSSGCFYSSGGRTGRFYTHAQSTIVICELYAMTNDKSLREPAERAIKYLVFTQGEEGGWRYQPKLGSDTSVTGWVVMALQSARMGGINVPSPCLDEVGKFLDSVASEEGSRYSYLPNRHSSRSMTAEALLCRQYLGWKHDDKRLNRGVAWLTMSENLINYRTSPETYYWYYATQVAHHMGGDAWERWNGAMRAEVPAQQVKMGREAGSWNPSERDVYDIAGGRLYVTCLSIYMLEVYYRHLPLYRAAW
ncbi:MAG: terpene cyclase/mutase family protein [Planctomycetia bacterium]|jgi:hypothetical protein